MQLTTRRELIETHLRYDAIKKNHTVPEDLGDWPWTDSNALDAKLKTHHFKDGIIAGYKTWRAVEIGRNDLLHCAICNKVFPGLPQVLGQLIECPEFLRWYPDRETDWFDRLEAGDPYPADWPLLLRPSVNSEAPAKWYIEDGTGRAICYLRRLIRHPEETGQAPGYLGVEPDQESNFMNQHFQELLSR